MLYNPRGDLHRATEQYRVCHLQQLCFIASVNSASFLAMCVQELYNILSMAPVLKHVGNRS